MVTDISNRSRGCNYLYGLYDLIKENVTKCDNIVEIGSHRGVSTELLAMFSNRVYAVDPWDLVEEYDEASFSMDAKSAEKEFRERLSSYNNVEVIKDFSENAYKLFENESIDMVYIDGWHEQSAVEQDILNWYPKVKRGGVISGHDGRNGSVNSVMLRLLGTVGLKRYSDTSWRYIK